MKSSLTTAGKTATAIATLFVACILIFGSCKKQAGPTGPTGPAGASGNANVTSMTTTVAATAWTWDGTSNYLYTNVAVPNITADIYNTGALMVYLQAAGGEWLPLARVIVASATVSQSQRFAYTTGNVKMILQNSDLTQPTGGQIIIKFVCIASSGRMAHPNVDLRNYTEVKETYNLED